jgi:hypothetical protein
MARHGQAAGAARADQLTWQRREQRIGGLLRIRTWTGRDVLPHDEGVSQRDVDVTK